MFAPAYVGGRRRAKPIQGLYSFSESVRRTHKWPTYANANMGYPYRCGWSYWSSSLSSSPLRYLDAVTLSQHERRRHSPDGNNSNLGVHFQLHPGPAIV